MYDVAVGAPLVAVRAERRLAPACLPSTVAYAAHVQSASSSWPGEPGSVPTARRWVTSTLASWGVGEPVWTAAQVVSELATNATLHARSAFTVTVTVDEQCLRLEVQDASSVALHTRQYGSTATTGRGLHIVSTLSHEWGVTPQGHGKTVWALLALDQVQDDEPASRRSSAPNAPATLRTPPDGPSTAARWSSAA